MKEPVSAVIAGILTVSLLLTTVSLAVDVARSTFASYNLCEWPLVALLPPCASAGARQYPSASEIDFPRLVAIQHRALDDFVQQSSAGLDLTLNIKHAELAVQDLIVLVKGSNILSKEPLAETLATFVLDAKESARGLQLFSSKVLGTIDRISTFNAYVLREIQAASSQGRWSELDAMLTRMFWISMEAFSSQVAQLLSQASVTEARLDALEERLTTANGFCVQEAFATSVAQYELLSQLWTFLGGNRHQIRDLGHRLTVLDRVQEYRTVAAAYIAAATQTLTSIDADLMELREQLASATVPASRVPVEVHIASIEQGLFRLREEKLKWRGGSDGNDALRDGERPVELLEADGK
ncbi:hypothetical protein BV20DRAFT_959432 [Pilatotrama ljubarskyi]|nr:hypothetical protein BV20DRAFT_959432 [Pilatotrama ljubarskyi]